MLSPASKRPPILLLFVGVGSFALLFACEVIAEKPKPEALTAKQILDRMKRVYASCKSYRDAGVVKNETTKAARLQEKTFTTSFKRPDRFRFVCQITTPTMPQIPTIASIVWIHGSEVRTNLSDIPGLDGKPTLELAIAGATGFSGAAAYRVPALLMPNKLDFRPLVDPESAERIEDAMLGQAACFRIRETEEGSSTTVWIDKKTSLVRRIDDSHTFDTFRSEMTTTYDAQIDIEISEKELEYDPPPSPEKALNEMLASPRHDAPEEEPEQKTWRERIGWPEVPAIVAASVLLPLLILLATRRRRAKQ